MLIRVHNAATNQVVLVNTNVIVCIDRCETKGKPCSRIYVNNTLKSDDGAHLTVNESVQKIFSMMPSEFIFLHDADSNSPVAISEQYIAKICPLDDGFTKIFTTANSRLTNFKVNETAEKIWASVNTTEKEK